MPTPKRPPTYTPKQLKARRRMLERKIGDVAGDLIEKHEEITETLEYQEGLKAGDADLLGDDEIADLQDELAAIAAKLQRRGIPAMTAELDRVERQLAAQMAADEQEEIAEAKDANFNAARDAVLHSFGGSLDEQALARHDFLVMTGAVKENGRPTKAELAAGEELKQEKRSRDHGSTYSL